MPLPTIIRVCSKTTGMQQGQQAIFLDAAATFKCIMPALTAVHFILLYSALSACT